jgi:hypothetical protein
MASGRYLLSLESESQNGSNLFTSQFRSRKPAATALIAGAAAGGSSTGQGAEERSSVVHRLVCVIRLSEGE